MGLFAVSTGEEESWSDDGCFGCSSGGANAATFDRHAVDSTRAVVIIVMVLAGCEWKWKSWRRSFLFLGLHGKAQL